jgi:dTDP-4-amino-4,6-dideoxygalactose transaminase
MGIFREIPPTAGFGITLKDFFRINEQGSLEDDFKQYLGLPYVAVNYSGTAALYFILTTLKKSSSKKTVILPSFICPLVTLAVIKAGLKIKICDIKPDRFDFDDKELQAICRDDGDILAVVAVHLGGVPVDLKGLQEITQRHKIFLIEDCAQALGAAYEGKKAGTWGDFSFFSLCRGKGLTIYEGGILACKDSTYIPALTETIKAHQTINSSSEALKVLELFGYALFYRPALFWFVFNLPQKFWEMRHNPVRAMGEYAKDFDTHKIGDFRKKIGHATFPKLGKEIARRRQIADFYFENIKRPGLEIIKELPNSYAVYPFVSVIVKDLNRRQIILKRINSLGLGASIIYVKAINEYDHLREFISPETLPHGRYLAEHAITLSTSSFLTQKNLEQIVRLTNSC